LCEGQCDKTTLIEIHVKEHDYYLKFTERLICCYSNGICESRDYSSLVPFDFDTCLPCVFLPIKG
jgi:hypothetical protein